MDQTINCSMTISSPALIVSDIKDTLNLFAGMYAYSSSLIPCSRIISIIGTTITLDSNSIATGTDNIIFSDLTPSQFLEKCEILKEAQDVINNQAGGVIKIFVRDESNIIRGKYRSIKTKSIENEIYIKAWPIVFSPNANTLEKLGLREEVDLAVTIPSKSWTDAGYTFQDFDLIRFTFVFNNESYEIKEKTRTTQVYNDFVFYNFGLFKL
jgi:hypothetical protein